MRSYIFRTLCLAAGFGALVTACGGGEEEETRAVLAVAFRLDEGTPIMVAYAGDPEEDPFVLPAGQYYIETLDEDDVVTSLGSVEIEAGEAVSFPSSILEGGGTSDPEAAEPLLTIANFLIDTELAEYAFLDIVTGGFELSPYDPDIEVSPEDVVALFEAYGGILDQKDALLTAIGKVEDRADVSARVRRVSPRWTPASQIFGDLREVVTAHLLKLADDDPYGIAEILKRGKDIVRRKEEAKIALIEESGWIVKWNESSDTVLGKEPGLVLPKVPDLVTKHREWEDYAKELVGTIEDEASAQRAQARLKNRITDDFAEYMNEAGVGSWPADGDVIVDYFVAEVFTGALGPAAALAGVSATPTPGVTESPAPTPYPDWIDPHVQAAGDQWRSMGFDESAVAVAENNLRACLLAAVEMGADEEAAKALCPSEGFEPGTPTPEPAEEATPTPTQTPAPTPVLGQPETAIGKYNDNAIEGWTDTENTVTLNWNSAGGPVSGEGRHSHNRQGYDPCGAEWYTSVRHYTGEYYAENQTFFGTYTGQWESVDWRYDEDFNCLEQHHYGTHDNVNWEATLSGGTVTGGGGLGFVLTVQNPGAGVLPENNPVTAALEPILLDSYFAAAIPSASRTPLLRPL